MSSMEEMSSSTASSHLFGSEAFSCYWPWHIPCSVNLSNRHNCISGIVGAGREDTVLLRAGPGSPACSAPQPGEAGSSVTGVCAAGHHSASPIAAPRVPQFPHPRSPAVPLSPCHTTAVCTKPLLPPEEVLIVHHLRPLVAV